MKKTMELLLFFLESNRINCLTFRVSSSGHTEYSIDKKITSYADYSSILETENIIIKAKNFLVFQGDIESVSSKSPKELTKQFEQISG